MPGAELERGLSPEQIIEENKKLDEIQEGFSGLRKEMFIRAREEHPPIIRPCGLGGFEGGFTSNVPGKIEFWFNDMDDSTHIMIEDNISE